MTPAGQDITTALRELPLGNLGQIDDLATAIRVGIRAALSNTMPVGFPEMHEVSHDHTCLAEAINSFVYECLGVEPNQRRAPLVDLRLRAAEVALRKELDERLEVEVKPSLSWSIENDNYDRLLKINDVLETFKQVFTVAFEPASDKVLWASVGEPIDRKEKKVPKKKS